MIALDPGRGFVVRLCTVALACAFGVTVASPADARPKTRGKTVSAKSETSTTESWRSGYAAIVVDANTGKVLHENNPDAPRHPASVTKIMTLYLLFEQLEAGRLKLDSALSVSARAAAQDPTKLNLKPGSTIVVEDAIKAVVTKSANDVAVVIAEAVGGDEASFAAQMTRKARALGMARTTFRNASGLPHPDQITTARDLSLLGRAIQERFPRYYRYFGTRQFTWRGDVVANHNRLLGRVEGVDGIKTGYTRASGFNLVTSARRDGRQIVAVVMGGRTGSARDAQMEELIDTYLPKAYAGQRTAPRIAEVAPAQRSAPRLPPGEPLKLDPAAHAELATTAAIPRPAPGSTEPLRPTAVRSVAVGPSTTSAPLGAIPRTTYASASPAPAVVYTTASAPAAPGQIGPTVITLATPAPPTPPARPGAIAAHSAHPAAPPVGPIAVAQLPVAPASATAAPVSAQRAARGDWMVQIGAFPDESQARDKLKAAQSRAKDVLGSADSFTEKVVKGSTALYRARFAGFDEDRAREACRVLKKSDFACMALKN